MNLGSYTVEKFRENEFQFKKGSSVVQKSQDLGKLEPFMY
jgi:hypothetical protein